MVEGAPAYLDPSEITMPTAKCLYEPPLAAGTQIRLGRFDPNSFQLLPTDEIVEIVGTGADEHTGPDGQIQRVPYAFGIWQSEEPPHVGDWGQLHEHCEREGITDIDAYLKTDAGRQWLTGGHKVGDRRKFYLGQQQFHSALLGTEWVPCVYETVRVKTQPVLGWAASKQQAAFRKRSNTENGHRGIARKAGRFARESDIERKRWTTTLSIEALATLDQLSSDLKLHRNEVVEQLVANADRLLD